MPTSDIQTTMLTPEFWESVILNVLLWGLLFGTLMKVFWKVDRRAALWLVPVGTLFCAVYFDIVLFLVKHDAEGSTFLTSGWMWERWWRRASYYSHGVLIIPVVCYLIWRKRESLWKIAAEPDPVGLWPIGLGLAMRVAASFPPVWFLSAFTMPLVLWGVILAFWGRRAARELLFPVVFLLAMIPLPLKVIDDTAVRMRNLATVHTVSIVRMMGLTALQDATFIHLWRSGVRETVQVGDVCSGLRSLIALLAFGALFAHLVPRSRWGKAAVFFSSVPIAYVSNLARVVVLTVLAWAFGADAIAPRELPSGYDGIGGFFSLMGADGGAAWDFLWHNTVHYGTGIVIFVFAFFALVGVNRIAEFVERRMRWTRKPLPERGRAVSSVLTARRLAILLGSFALAAALSVYITVGKPETPDLARAGRIAFTLGPWQGEEMPVSDLEKRILETDNLIVRNYTRPGAPAPVMLAVIYSENDRKVVHPPPICYTGAGFTVENQSIVPLGFSGPDGSNEHRVAVCTAEKFGSRILTLYWYMIGDLYTGNYLEAQIRQVWARLLGRRSSIALIRLSTPIMNNDADAAERLMREFSEYLEPQLRRHLMGKGEATDESGA